MKPKKSRWHRLCNVWTTDNDKITALWDCLVALYDSPPRAYHSLHHVNAMLDHFDEHREISHVPNLVEFAIWLHDCVYDVKADDNEARSYEVSAIFYKTLSASRELAEIESATVAPCTTDLDYLKRLILATRHGQNFFGYNADDQLISDLDMLILAAPEEEYDEYALDIRYECSACLTAQEYIEGRKSFLEKILNDQNERLSGQRIFQIIGFEYEAKARKNLKRELASLNTG